MKLKYKLKVFLIALTTFIFFNANAFAQETSAEQNKQLVKAAVIYALENRDPHMDYGKYVSKKFINPIDGKTFNYEQWVTHQKHIKELVKSMTPTFDLMVAEGNQVAAIYHIDVIKNDNSKLTTKDLAFFTIKNNKIVYCEELTYLLKGDKKDQHIGSTS